MKQYQHPKEVPRKNDKFETFGLRLELVLKRKAMARGGSKWVRELIRNAP